MKHSRDNCLTIPKKSLDVSLLIIEIRYRNTEKNVINECLQKNTNTRGFTCDIARRQLPARSTDEPNSRYLSSVARNRLKWITLMSATNFRRKKFCESTRTGSRSPARSGTNPLTAGVAPFPPATTRQPLTRRLSPGPRAVDLPPPTSTHSPCANITYPTSITSATFAKPPPSPLLPSPVSITMVMLTRCALSCMEFIFFFFFVMILYDKSKFHKYQLPMFSYRHQNFHISILKCDIFKSKRL